MTGESAPKIVAGVDEAGRGPIAGPVVSAAAILSPIQVRILLSAGLNDSKKLSVRARENLFLLIRELRVVWRAGVCIQPALVSGHHTSARIPFYLIMGMDGPTYIRRANQPSLTGSVRCAVFLIQLGVRNIRTPRQIRHV